MSARRLLLSVDELAVLCHDQAVLLPAGYAPALSGQPGDLDAALDTARASLTQRGITGAALTAVAENLRLFAAAQVVLTIDIAVDHDQVHALIAVTDTIGATLRHAGGQAIELSAWRALELPHELRRIVPDLPATTTAPTVTVDVQALIAALALQDNGQDDLAVRAIGGTGGGAADNAEFLALAENARGSLHCTVLTGVAGDVAPVGHVVWIVTAAGWLALRRHGYGAVDATPVQATDLGQYVAPFIAELVS